MSNVLGTGGSLVCESFCTMCQGVARNIKDNVYKEAFKGMCGSQSSREIKGMGFGIIQTGFDGQINQSLAVCLHAVYVTSQSLLL